MPMITLLACYERISLFHTMEPFFLKKYRRHFRLTSSPEYCLREDKNKILFMERWFQNDRHDTPPDLELMRRLREKYSTIVFLCGYPAAGTHRLEVFPYVDRFFHKSVFADRHHYQEELYAKRLFSDYYHKKYGVEDSDPEYTCKPDLTAAETDRIELSWNIGLGDYPRRNWPQRAGVVLARMGFPGLGRLFKTGRSTLPPDFSSDKRRLDVHARIDPVRSESVSYQRKIFIEQTAGKSGYTTGLVPQNQYYKELYNSKMVLSPFGWGEVCFRDFEAIISGALLLKPDMSHMRTWPDVYVPNETYVPLDWDGKDLEEKTDYYLRNPGERARIAQNAWDHYHHQLDALEARFEELFSSIIDR